MSESIRRRNSSRQMLQNLIRVTAQRSQEDAEEAERERRRRARERQRDVENPSPSEAPECSELTHDTEFDGDVKAGSYLVLEEDEGFSDWSHRLETRHEQEVPNRRRASEQRPSAPQWKPEPAEETQQEEEVKQEGRESSQEPLQRPTEKTSSVRKEKEVRTSFSSSVFLSQDSRLPADMASYLVAGTMKPGARACGGDAEAEQEEKEAGQLPEQEDGMNREKLSFTHQQKEDVCLETRRQEDEHKLADAPDATTSVTNRGGRTEETNASAAPVLSCSSSYGPMSPTFKKLLIQFYPDEVNSRVSTEKCTVMERTESLRRSTNSIKKTPPPVAFTRIDKKLEQYTQALEISSMEGRSGCQALTDLTSPAEPVASKKNLFEAREVCNQSPTSGSPFKDADGLKVAVADLINQWVRGSEAGSRCISPSRPAESCTAKKYKFVVTGHGKYEKVSLDGCGEDVSCQAAGLFCEDS